MMQSIKIQCPLILQNFLPVSNNSKNLILIQIFVSLKKLFPFNSQKSSRNQVFDHNSLEQGRIHGHTSCGRVGRGGNARFYTFRLVHTDGRTDGWTDKGSYRVACPQLKTNIKASWLPRSNLARKENFATSSTAIYLSRDIN